LYSVHVKVETHFRDRTGPYPQRKKWAGGGGSTQLGPIGKAMAQRFRIDLIIDNVICNRYGCINA